MRPVMAGRLLPPSLGAGAFHRHCEAAKRPKQSRRAAPRVMGGRPTVWPRPILDCFARASRGLAMTENAPSLAPAMTGMRRRFAPARNDGEPLARQRGGIWSSSAI